MCYHFKNSDTQEYVDYIVKRLNLKKYVWQGRYYINGFNHSACAVLAQGQPDEIVEMEWGLIPRWVKTEEQAKESAKRCLNAKSETIFELNSFRGCIKKQKCLIIADSFFEWRHITTKLKIPYRIGVRNSEDEFTPFTLGGIYDRWTNPETGEVKDTFAIITTPANSVMEIIHNSKKRMPLIIPDELQLEWLSTTDEEAIKKLMSPLEAEKMIAYPITKTITDRDADKEVPELVMAGDYTEVQSDEFL